MLLNSLLAMLCAFWKAASSSSCAEGGCVSYQLVGGRSIDFDELLDTAIEGAPLRPPQGWTFDDWRMRGFVPDPCPTNAD